MRNRCGEELERGSSGREERDRVRNEDREKLETTEGFSKGGDA